METPLLDRFFPADRRPDLEVTRSSAFPSAGGADVALRDSGASIGDLLKKCQDENERMKMKVDFILWPVLCH